MNLISVPVLLLQGGIRPTPEKISVPVKNRRSPFEGFLRLLIENRQTVLVHRRIYPAQKAFFSPVIAAVGTDGVGPSLLRPGGGDPEGSDFFCRFFFSLRESDRPHHDAALRVFHIGHPGIGIHQAVPVSVFIQMVHHRALRHSVEYMVAGIVI